MTAVLVTLAAQKRFLGIADAVTTYDTLLQELIDYGELELLEQAGRRLRPFSTAQAARSEVRDGTGTEKITLDYTITSLTSIKIGRDVTDPDETLDVADVDVLVYTAGRRVVYRTDGGIFACANDPRMVHITYAAAADTPTHPQTALKRIVATVFRQRGSEDASKESLDDYSHDLRQAGDEDSLWRMAVERLWDPEL